MTKEEIKELTALSDWDYFALCYLPGEVHGIGSPDPVNSRHILYYFIWASIFTPKLTCAIVYPNLPYPVSMFVKDFRAVYENLPGLLGKNKPAIDYTRTHRGRVVLDNGSGVLGCSSFLHVRGWTFGKIAILEHQYMNDGERSDWEYIKGLVRSTGGQVISIKQ
jgi:hypothetical protein